MWTFLKMPVVNQMSRLAGVVSRLELAADNLGAGIIDVKKYQNRDMLPLLVSRIEKAASFFDNKSVPSSFLHGPVPHPYRESKSTEPTAGITDITSLCVRLASQRSSRPEAVYQLCFRCISSLRGTDGTSETRETCGKSRSVFWARLKIWEKYAGEKASR